MIELGVIYVRCLYMKRIIALLLAIVTLSVLLAFSVFAAVIPGDVDGSGTKDYNDAIYLLYHYYFDKNDGNDEYPVNQACDFDGNGRFDANDAIYLLYNVFFTGEEYPLHTSIDTSGKDNEGSEYGEFIPLI